MEKFILERAVQKGSCAGKEIYYVNIGDKTLQLNINIDILPHFLQNVELEVNDDSMALKPGNKNVFVVEYKCSNNCWCDGLDVITPYYKIVKFTETNSPLNSITYSAGAIIEVPENIEYVVMKKSLYKGFIYGTEITYLYVDKDEAREVDVLTFINLVANTK